MKKYKGSFTIEAAYIVPLILFLVCLTVEIGIGFHEEIRMQAESLGRKKPMDMVSCMYRREYVKDLFGELYED